MRRVNPTFDESPSFRDDVRQELQTHLFVADGDTLPRIAQYHAGGPLSAWVATSARGVDLARIQLAVDRMTPDAASYALLLLDSTVRTDRDQHSERWAWEAILDAAVERVGAQGWERQDLRPFG